jgi:hypothetical protein
LPLTLTLLSHHLLSLSATPDLHPPLLDLLLLLLPHLPDPLLHSLHHPLLLLSLPLMTSPSDALATAASDLV